MYWKEIPGKERWRRELAEYVESRLDVFRASPLRIWREYGKLSVLAGTEGWFVNAFGHDGSSQMGRMVSISRHYRAESGRYGRRWKSAEILVGTEYCTPLTVHNFDGSFRWSTFEQVGSHGNATTPRRGICLKHMVLCDLNHDGILEIIYGTEDGWVYAVKPQDGAELWHTNLVGEIALGLSS